MTLYKTSPVVAVVDKDDGQTIDVALEKDE